MIRQKLSDISLEQEDALECVELLELETLMGFNLRSEVE